MKRGIIGILVFPLVVMIFALPGCTSIQDHWTVPDDQMPAAEAPPVEVPSSGSADRDSAPEARRQEDAAQREEAARREAQAREEARKQEEVRRMLEDLEASHRRAEAEERARQEGGQADANLKPRYYVVRAGDTFNSIAANPRVYGNRSEWFTLYQANRDKLGNPDNPDLLAPGTVIEIPSIAGEAREGTY